MLACSIFLKIELKTGFTIIAYIAGQSCSNSKNFHLLNKKPDQEQNMNGFEKNSWNKIRQFK